MQLHTLEKITKKRLRRLGQGHGSGRVKTAGRGTKGQNARSKRGLLFEGGALPLKKRLPFLRGKQKNKGFKPVPVVIQVTSLNSLPKDSVVDAAFLVKKGLVNPKDIKDGIKIVGKGPVSVSLKVSLPVSLQAAKAIEKIGGTLVR